MVSCRASLHRALIDELASTVNANFREAFSRTPLSIEEDIPCNCWTLVVGIGTGNLPVMDEVDREAKRRGIELLILPTANAIAELIDP